VRLLVTGGSGFLGSELARQARAAGWDVVATHRSRPQPGPVPLDATDPAAVEALVARARPDAVVHTAYVLSGPELEPLTGSAPGVVARAAARAGARLVHLSTDLVFDGVRGGYAESDPLSPIIPYGHAKARAEREVAAADPGALIVRTSLLLDSPDGPGPQEERPLAVARGELEMGFFTDELRSPLSVRDLAAALLECVARPELHGPLHLAGPDTVSRLELAQLVCRQHGLDPSGLRGSLAAALPDPRPRDCSLDSSRAAALLATRIRGIREVLA
jgi:dTDP-4-dehydrorhamnose reductase